MDRTGGDAMASRLALLCLGLSVGIRILVNAGTIPRPILWAEPGSVVLRNTPVTLWCRGTVRAQQFHLVKTGNSPPWETNLTPQLGDKVKVSVLYITESHAGTYHCSYYSPAGWSESSDPLELVVTGFHSKPSLSAFPSPVVASGETVTLQCDSWQGFDTFVLTQEGDPETRWKLGSQRLSSGGSQALFKVGSVAPGHRWSFRCYGLFSQTPHEWSHPSNPLQLLVSGASRRPSLLSPEGQIVTPGQISSLQCHSKVAYETFALYKEKSRDITQHPGHHPQAGLSLANFTLGPVRAFHGGRYRCIGRTGFTSLWSEPSDPVDILVEGEHPYRPTLSVESGPSVSLGDNVTLLCQSGGWRDTLLLAKEGTVDPPLRIKVNKTEEKTQTQFSFHPVTSAHNGTYRCYSSNSNSPYRLSYPSAPLHLRVSGEEMEGLRLSPRLPHSFQGPSVDSRTMSTAGMGEFLGSIQEGDKIWDQRGAEEGDRKDEGSDREVLSPGSYKRMKKGRVGVGRDTEGRGPCGFLCSLQGTRGLGVQLILPLKPGPSDTSACVLRSWETLDRNNPEPLLIGLSTAGALLGLFLLLFLLLFLRHRRQAGHHRSGAAHPAPRDTGLNTRSRPSAHIQEDRPEATITHKKSKEGAQLDPQSRQDEDPHGATYAQVKHAGLRRGVASGTPLSGPRRNAQDRQTEEDTQAGRQEETPEASLEVTYAQLKHLDTAQESTAPPPSLSGEPPQEPSVYAALAFH